MKFADAAILARCRDVDIACVVNAVEAIIQEVRCLIKPKQVGINHLAIPDVNTIKCLKCLSSTAVATVADVGARQCGAVLAIARRWDTMLSIKIKICRDLTSWDKRLIVLKQACRNFLVHDSVNCSREQVNLIVFQIDVGIVY